MSATILKYIYRVPVKNVDTLTHSRYSFCTLNALLSGYSNVLIISLSIRFYGTTVIRRILKAVQGTIGGFSENIFL